MRVMYVHGLESSARARKALFIREQVPELVCPDFVGTLDERMREFERQLGEESWALVGSSFGGLMSALWGCAHPGRVHRLVLLAPALHHDAFVAPADPVTFPVTVFFGSRDEVIPVAPVREKAKRAFSSLSWREVDDDHRLWPTCQSIDWRQLLATTGAHQVDNQERQRDPQTHPA